MNSENDKINHPVMICAIRNTLSRLPEYEYIKDRQPYVKEKDGRLYFDLTERVFNTFILSTWNNIYRLYTVFT
jgi:hypothetical protein